MIDTERLFKRQALVQRVSQSDTVSINLKHSIECQNSRQSTLIVLC